VFVSPRSGERLIGVADNAPTCLTTQRPGARR
jgi:hypothetical protein